MILKRLATAIRTQNWFTVIIELVIVVAGILIAVQIDAWNEARKNDQLERVYLEQLHTDLVQSLEETTSKTGAWDRERIRTQAVVLKSLRAKILLEEDKADFIAGLVLSGRINNPTRRWASVEEMKATGAINLIKDVQIRSGIVKLEADYERTLYVMSNARESINLIRSKLAHLYDPVTYEFFGLGTAEANFDFDRLIETPDVTNLFSNIQQLSIEASGFRHTYTQQLEKLKTQIEKSLNTSIIVARGEEE